MALKLVVAPGRILHRSLQQNPNQRSLSLSSAFSYPLAPKATSPSNLCLTTSRIHHNRFVTYCINRAQEFVEDVPETPTENEYEVHKDFKQEEKRVAKVEKKELANQGLWNQMKEIIMFTGPATGLWICGPLMSLIDTAVIGQGSSVELAALGPATVVCDYMSYTFMFLSVATSNMVATALARRRRSAASAFVGQKNVHVVPAANTYVQIRGLAWPALLVGWVAQSASLGMKDSWGPLKALAAASVINGIGDILLCSMLGYGIAGAARATLASQVVAGYMMTQTLK